MRIKFVQSNLIVIMVFVIASWGSWTKGLSVTRLATHPGESFHQSLGPSCSQPTGEAIEPCQEVEREILASTVRIEFYWDELSGVHKNTFREISLGTIDRGRYVVTHHHFSSTLMENLYRREKNIRFSLYTSSGETIVTDVPTTALSVSFAEAETLVLDFGEYTSEDMGRSQESGLFGVANLASAQYKAWPVAGLMPGVEVAQVQWNGLQVGVQWVRVLSVDPMGDITTLSLSSIPGEGSSGGGIFWKGYHVANNWLRTIDRNVQDGQIIKSSSTAVLDSPALIRMLEDSVSNKQ